MSTSTSETNGNGHVVESKKEQQPLITSNLVLSFLTGLFLSSLGSAVLLFIRLDSPNALPQLPPVTYRQCMVLCSLCIVVMLLYCYQVSMQLKMLRLGVPVVSSNLVFLGHALTMMTTSPWDLLLRWHKTRGDVFCFPLLGRTMVSIANPAYLKLVLQSKIRSVKKDVGFTYAPFLVILGHGIVTSEGQSWMKQRLKMSTALRIDVLDVIPKVTLEAVQRLESKLDEAAATGQAVDIAKALRHLTLQVISNTFLSISAEESDSTFAKMYLPIVDECNTRVWHPWRAICFFLPFFWKHWFHVYRLNAYVSGLITKRWNERQLTTERKHDIMDTMLDAYEKEFPNNTRLPRRALVQMRDEMKTFMLAGHETSAAMMTWALYELMASPELQDQVAKEGTAVFGTKDWNADWVDASDLPPRDELANLVVAEGCLKESLRKYAVVPMVVRKVVLEDIKMDENVTITKGCTVVINVQAVHHDATHWPEPMKFDPYRFVNRRPDPYTFLPFIEGPRNCLGQHLALLESKMVLGLLTQRYTFSSVEPLQTQLHGDLERDPRHRYNVPVSVKKDLYIKVERKKL